MGFERLLSELYFWVILSPSCCEAEILPEIVDGWIKEFIKQKWSSGLFLGSRGCREKTAISKQLFGVFFSTFCGPKMFKKLKNSLASAQKNTYHKKKVFYFGLKEAFTFSQKLDQTETKIFQFSILSERTWPLIPFSKINNFTNCSHFIKGEF